MDKKDLSESKIISSFGEAVKAYYNDTWNVIILAEEIQRRELWKVGGNYDSFEQFLADYKLKPSTIYAYIRMRERLLDRGVKSSEMAAIPPGAAMLISTKEDPEKYIELAKSGSWTDVRKKIMLDSGKTEKEVEDACEVTKPCPYWKDCVKYGSKIVNRKGSA